MNKNEDLNVLIHRIITKGYMKILFLCDNIFITNLHNYKISLGILICIPFLCNLFKFNNSYVFFYIKNYFEMV